MGAHKIPKERSEPLLPKEEYRKRRGNTGAIYAHRIRGINLCLGCGKFGGTLVVLFKDPNTGETRYTHKGCYNLSRAAIMGVPAGQQAPVARQLPLEEVKQGAVVGATLSVN